MRLPAATLSLFMQVQFYSCSPRERELSDAHRSHAVGSRSDPQSAVRRARAITNNACMVPLVTATCAILDQHYCASSTRINCIAG